MQSGIQCSTALLIPPYSSRRRLIDLPSVPRPAPFQPAAIRPAIRASRPPEPSVFLHRPEIFCICPNRLSAAVCPPSHLLLPLRRILLHWPAYSAMAAETGSTPYLFSTQKAPREERSFGISDQSTNTAFLYSSGISMPRMDALVLLMMTVRSAGSCTGISCGLPLPSRMSAAMSPAWMPVL